MMPILDLDDYFAAIAAFRAEHPKHTEAMDSPCECDDCESLKAAARRAWRRWLARRRGVEPTLSA